MGTLLRCTKCDKEMVIEPVHAGRTVPCPWCRAPAQVPVQLDFKTAAVAARRDESAGGVFLALSVVGLLLSCLVIGLAVGAVIWWMAQGRIHRARDDGRPVDPLVAAARTISIVATVIGLIAALLWGKNLF